MINLSKTNLTFAVTYENQFNPLVLVAAINGEGLFIRFSKPNANRVDFIEKPLTMSDHKPCKDYVALTLKVEDLVAHGEWVADIVYHGIGDYSLSDYSDDYDGNGNNLYIISHNNANVETMSRTTLSNGVVIEE
jgi:hypothetical protein